MDLDLGVRIAAFKWLTEQNLALGDVLPRSLLLQGFLYEGQRIPLVSPQGIFKPKIISLPLSITTVFEGPYDDRSTPEGTLIYRYRGTDPNHRDNAGLRELMKMNRPLAYFYGMSPGQYMTIWPVYIVGDDTRSLSFRVALDAIETVTDPPEIESNDTQIRRAYLTASVKIRLHQRSFRERVLEAYRSTCAFCKLRHRELLDAAHILPDAHPAGIPSIQNGVALCKLHHAAFDSFMLGITPDYIIQVRKDVLDEEDGPMLQYGLKGLQNCKLILPSSRNSLARSESSCSTLRSVPIEILVQNQFP